MLLDGHFKSESHIRDKWGKSNPPGQYAETPGRAARGSLGPGLGLYGGSVRDGESLADLLPAVASSRPDETALIFEDSRLTWAELDAAVERVAAVLRATGLGPGERVAISLGSTPDFVAALHGILRAGLVAVPTNPGYTAREMAHVLGDSGARVLIARATALPTVRQLRAELPALMYVWVVGDGPNASTELEHAAGESAFPAPFEMTPSGPGDESSDRVPGSGEDLAVLVYTSGTSGAPRGAMLSHRALLADLDHVTRIEPPVVTPGDVVLLAVPLFHIYGLNSGLGMVIRHGAAGLLVERFEPAATLTAIREKAVTTIIAVPQMYLAWSMEPQIDEAFDSVRMAVSGSAPVAPAVLQRILDSTGKHVFEGYGLTETGPTVASTLMSEVPKPGSIGRPVPGVRVRLVEPTGEPDAAQVDAEDAGEIAVSGDNLFSGYWPDGADGPDSAGWWCTGDVAYADADGDLHLVDRRRELILVSGFNVYPREVEQVLIEHPGVEDAAVVGIPHPYTGETVRAFVVRRPGAEVDGSGTRRVGRPPAGQVQVPDDDLVRRGTAVHSLGQGASGRAPGGRRIVTLWLKIAPVQCRCAQPRGKTFAAGRPWPCRHRFRSGPPMNGMTGSGRRTTHSVTLLTRPGCHLCEDARVIVERVVAEEGAALTVQNVDLDLRLASEYGDRVPVVLVDGKEHGYWRVEEPRLRRALQGRRGWLR